MSFLGNILGNKWSGFAEEIGISVILTFVFYLLMYISGATEGHSIGDLVALVILAYVIMGGIMRIIRWAIAYKAPVFLYFLHFPAFIGIFTAAMMLQHPGMWNIIGSISIFALVGVYFLILFIFRRKGIMKKSPPGYRFAVLRREMSVIERITLVFPDRYLMYLQTGDVKYLQNDSFNL